VDAPEVRPLRSFAHPAGWCLWTLGWACYVIFFASVWGPLVAWKLALAVLLHLGLGLGLAVGDVPGRRAHRPRRRFVPGLRSARSRARWPTSRRVAAFVSGALLCAVGVGQSLGLEVDIARYPLISGLCVIVSVAVGLPLTLIAAQPGR